MKHIITTAFILTLTACYPVHAKQLNGKDAEKIWVNGEIISNQQNGGKIRGFIRYKKNLYYCEAEYMRPRPLAVNCIDTEKN